MSVYAYSVFCLVIALMTSHNVTGQTHDVAQLNRRLTLIKSSVDRDISDMKLQILELKMNVDQIMVSLDNASDGSLIVGQFDDYGQGRAGVSRNEIKDLKTKLTTHESRLDKLSTTVNHIQVEKSEIKSKVDKLVEEKKYEEKINGMVNSLKEELRLQLNADFETKCSDRVNALQKTFEETATVMRKGYKDLKTHVNGIAKFESKPVDRNEMKVFVLEQMNNLSKTVISEQTKLSERNMKFESKPVDRNEMKVFVLEQMNNLSKTVISEQTKLSERHMATVLLILAGEVNKLDGVTEELKTKIDKCCKGQQPVFQPGVSTTPAPILGTTILPNGFRIKAIFGSDILKHIDIGTRVVRGADWSWDEQDGGGPGTVVSWHGGGRGRQEVNVIWDQGKIANYRVGAYGKYDLYILADGQ